MIVIPSTRIDPDYDPYFPFELFDGGDTQPDIPTHSINKLGTHNTEDAVSLDYNPANPAEPPISDDGRGTPPMNVTDGLRGTMPGNSPAPALRGTLPGNDAAPQLRGTLPSNVEQLRGTLPGNVEQLRGTLPGNTVLRAPSIRGPVTQSVQNTQPTYGQYGQITDLGLMNPNIETLQPSEAGLKLPRGL